MTNKTKAAIEVAAKLPTAEETLRKHIDNSDPMNQPFDEMYVGETNAMIDAIESHTAAHTAALQESVKELEAKLTRLDKECEYLSAENTDLSYRIEGIRYYNKVLRERMKELEAENTRYREALERAYNDFKSSRWTEETYKIVIEALKNNEG